MLLLHAAPQGAHAAFPVSEQQHGVRHLAGVQHGQGPHGNLLLPGEGGRRLRLAAVRHGGDDGVDPRGGAQRVHRPHAHRAADLFPGPVSDEAHEVGKDEEL